MPFLGLLVYQADSVGLRSPALLHAGWQTRGSGWRWPRGAQEAWVFTPGSRAPGGAREGPGETNEAGPQLVSQPDSGAEWGSAGARAEAIAELRVSAGQAQDGPAGLHEHGTLVSGQEVGA